jgi:hypothetical protein
LPVLKTFTLSTVVDVPVFDNTKPTPLPLYKFKLLIVEPGATEPEMVRAVAAPAILMLLAVTVCPVEDTCTVFELVKIPQIFVHVKVALVPAVVQFAFAAKL